MRIALMLVFWVSSTTCAQTNPERISQPGRDDMLQAFARSLAQAFPSELRPDVDQVDWDATDLRACIPLRTGETYCSHDLGAFGLATHPERNEPYEMRTYRPADATEPTIRYPRIAGFVAADFAIRQIVPLVLREAGFDSDAGRLEALESARTESEIRALAEESKLVFERLRALPVPAAREERRKLMRARAASRLAWQATLPLRRIAVAPVSAVFAKLVELVSVAVAANPTLAATSTVEMLDRVALVARTIRSWRPPADSH